MKDNYLVNCMCALTARMNWTVQQGEPVAVKSIHFGTALPGIWSRSVPIDYRDL